MTRVLWEPEELRLTVRGHAGSAPAGEDLVCAAASILAWTLADMATRTAAFYGHVRVREQGAEIMVHCSPAQTVRGRCRAVFETIAAGFELLAERYPKYLRMETRTEAGSITERIGQDENGGGAGGA